MLILILVVILAALVFEFINGFHDTANSIATVVATKVLSPGAAVMLAVGMNLIGAMTGTAVALTITSGILDTTIVEVTPQIVLAALLGGIVWNLITWLKGLPSSSSHALIGGLCGAGLTASHHDWNVLIWSRTLQAANWAENEGLLWKVLIPMITSPIAGFIFGIFLILGLWSILFFFSKSGSFASRLARPYLVGKFFCKAQILSAAYMGYAHGRNDAQKTMGIIAMTLMSADTVGALQDLPRWLDFLHFTKPVNQGIATWIILLCALVMAAGTASGGWRIIKTLGHRMVRLHPIQGFAAETSSATMLTIAAHFGMPVSTTHSISAAIMGVGFAKNPRSLRLNIIERIVWSWLLTIPAAGFVSYIVLHVFYWFKWT